MVALTPATAQPRSGTGTKLKRYVLTGDNSLRRPVLAAIHQMGDRVITPVQARARAADAEIVFARQDDKDRFTASGTVSAPGTFKDYESTYVAHDPPTVDKVKQFLGQFKQQLFGVEK